MSNSMEKAIQEEEKRDRRNSIIITTAITIVLLLVSNVWNAVAGIVPPPEEKQYVTTGRMDFGNMKQGRRKVNNFEKPSDTPADKPVVEKSDPVPTPPAQPKASETNNATTSKTPSENAAPKTNPTAEKSTTDKSATAEKAEKNTSKTDTKADTPKDSKPNTPTDNKDSGGSDHGNSNEKGNAGSPKAKTLDTKGLFSFGDGGTGGLNGRALESYELAKYTAAKDTRMVVEFYIENDGRVRRVLYPIGADLELFQIAKKTIQSFRFNQVDDNQPPQKTKVTLILKRS